jgi:hypothetical protein
MMGFVIKHGEFVNLTHNLAEIGLAVRCFADRRFPERR